MVWTPPHNFSLQSKIYTKICASVFTPIELIIGLSYLIAVFCLVRDSYNLSPKCFVT